MLHYKPKDWYVGDVHPYYHNDKLYLFYLKPNGITRCDACFEDSTKVVCSATIVAISDNYCAFTEAPISDIVVNIVKVGDVFFSRHNDNGAAFESTDLLHWEKSDRYPFLLDETLFPAKARDYACFYDEDEKGMRITMNAYFTNEHNGYGKGLDCAVGISTVIAQTGDGRVPQRILYPFCNQGRDVMRSAEPECNQMLKIGDRWYLFTSVARQTVHWVGPLSYWIGNQNTPIDKDEFGHKREYRLDGEDLSAAQIAPFRDKFYKFGWIPMNYNGQEWGGHLNLPHEVYPLEDGRLGCRLDPAFARSIVARENSHEVHYPEFVSPFGRCALTTVPTNFGLRARLDLHKSECAGLVLDKQAGIAAVLDRAMHRLRVVRQAAAGCLCFASMEIDPAQWSGPATLHAIYDEDIVEVFLNDTYALCARTDRSNSGNTAGAFCDREMHWLRSYALQTPPSTYHITHR